jgi:hypothetical protein
MRGTRCPQRSTPTRLGSGADVKFSTLSPPRRRLVRLMQSLRYGRLHDLVVGGGEPVFEPAPRIVRTVRLRDGAFNDPPPQAEAADFAVCAEVLALLRHLDQLRNGRILRVDVVHGVPTFFELEGHYDAEREGRP